MDKLAPMPQPRTGTTGAGLNQTRAELEAQVQALRHERDGYERKANRIDDEAERAKLKRQIAEIDDQLAVRCERISALRERELERARDALGGGADSG